MTPAGLSTPDELLERACDHAQIPRARVRVFTAPGPATSARHAVFVEPGSDVHSVPAFPLKPDQVREANEPGSRDLDRIVVVDLPAARAGLGLLRHEIEHAVQCHEAFGAFQFIGIVECAVALAIQAALPPTLDGSGAIYNSMPSELDANRESAALTRDEYGPPTPADDVCGFGNLFREQGRSDPSSLARRLFAFATLFPAEIATAAARRWQPLDGALAALDRAAPGIWSALAQTTLLADEGRAALAAAPDQAAVDAAPYPAAAWRPVRDHLEQAAASVDAALTLHGWTVP